MEKFYVQYSKQVNSWKETHTLEFGSEANAIAVRDILVAEGYDNVKMLNGNPHGLHF